MVQDGSLPDEALIPLIWLQRYCDTGCQVTNSSSHTKKLDIPLCIGSVKQTPGPCPSPPHISRPSHIAEANAFRDGIVNVIHDRGSVEPSVRHAVVGSNDGRGIAVIGSVGGKNGRLRIKRSLKASHSFLRPVTHPHKTSHVNVFTFHAAYECSAPGCRFGVPAVAPPCTGSRFARPVRVEVAKVWAVSMAIPVWCSQIVINEGGVRTVDTGDAAGTVYEVELL